MIRNDGEDETAPSVAPRDPGAPRAGEEIIAVIRDRGIAGTGSTALPGYFKRSTAVGKADVLILDDAECEPYIASDSRAVIDYPREVAGGPMRGAAQHSLDVPVIKGSNAVLAFTDEDMQPADHPRFHPPRPLRGRMPHAPDAPFSCTRVKRRTTTRARSACARPSARNTACVPTCAPASSI